jgi:predicted DNA binding CopG/RHH family protein
MPEREKRITVRVPESLHHKVKVKAALVGKSVSDVLREYLDQWAVDVEPQPKAPKRSKV